MTTIGRLDLSLPLPEQHRAVFLRRLVDETERPRMGCWTFLGQWKRSDRYGRMQIDGLITYAHRIAYALAFGPIPADLFVCHHCDNPQCVRPDHLFLGTQADNVKDMWAKGRGSYPPIGARGTRRA